MTRDRRRMSSNDPSPDSPDDPPTDADSPTRPAEDGTRDDDTRRPGPAPVPERYAFDAEEGDVVVYDRERSDAWLKSDYATEVGPAGPGDPTED